MVTAEYGGSGSISIYPSLRYPLTNGVTFLYRDSDNITFTAFRNIENVQAITFTDGILSESGTITLIEAL